MRIKTALLALTALLTVSALPAAHADGYVHDGFGEPVMSGGDHGRHEMREHKWHELREAQERRRHDMHHFFEAREHRDWDGVRMARMQVAQDDARINHLQNEMRFGGFEHREHGDWR